MLRCCWEITEDDTFKIIKAEKKCKKGVSPGTPSQQHLKVRLVIFNNINTCSCLQLHAGPSGSELNNIKFKTINNKT